MSSRKKVIAISGSTRQNSSNHKLINAIAVLAADQIEVTIYESIAALPHFNPDDTDKENTDVKNLRRLLREADGIIICTPEYAHGVPGSLKNAIDWTVSTSEFYHKPTVLITASTDGRFGHNALLETLKVIEAKNVEQLQMVIQFIRTKVSEDSKIIHPETETAIKELMDKFITTINNKEEGQ